MVVAKWGTIVREISRVNKVHPCIFLWYVINAVPYAQSNVGAGSPRPREAKRLPYKSGEQSSPPHSPHTTKADLSPTHKCNYSK